MKTSIGGFRLREWPLRLSVFLVAVGIEFGSASSLRAQNQTVTGNLSVTGTVDVDGNTLTFGTQSTAPGLSLTYTDADSDTLTFFLNRNPASFLWAHSASIAAMRLDSSHQLVLYKSDGTTAGLTFTPATNTISLGATTLYRDSSSGALRTNGALTVDGSLAASNGSFTGGSSGLTLNAGGTNQSITLTPSGTGKVVLNGNVGIGTTTPATALHVVGNSGAIENIYSEVNSANANGAGFAALKSRGAPGAATSVLSNDDILALTGYAFNGSSYSFNNAAQIKFKAGAVSGSNVPTNITFFTTSGGTSATEKMRIDSSGYVGLGATSPGTRLDVVGGASGGTESIYARNTAGGGFLYMGFKDSGNYGRIGAYNSGWQPLVLNEGGGNVGIGTAAPGTKLEVVGGALGGTESIYVRNSSSGGMTFIGYSDTNNYGRIGAYYNGWRPLVLNQSGGNVGVGTANPGAKFDVAGDLRVSFQSSLGGNTEYARIHLSGSDNAGGMQVPAQIVALTDNVTPSSGYVPSSLIFKTGYNSAPPERLRITSSGDFRFSNPYSVTPNMEYMRLILGSNDNAGAIQAPIQIIAQSESPTPSSGYVPSSLVFKTGYNSAPPERLRITSSGDFRFSNPYSVTPNMEYMRLILGSNDNTGGIQAPIQIVAQSESPTPSSGYVPSSLVFKTGYNSVPGEHLRISSNGDIRFTNPWGISGVTEYVRVLFATNDNGGGQQVPVQLVSVTESTPSSGSASSSFVIKTGYNSVPPERLRVTSAGNVGIGTASPSAKLSVNGDVKVAGSILIPPQGDLSMGTFTQGPSPTGL